MKTLELKQMERLQGGGCTSDLFGFGISTFGFIVAIIAVSAVTAPIGGLALLGFLASAAGAGYSGAEVILGGNCM